MAHLLPSAGVQEPKGDQFRFYRVVENLDCAPTFDDIPSNIYDYRWTDYLEEAALCDEEDEEFGPYPQQALHPQSGGRGQYSGNPVRTSGCGGATQVSGFRYTHPVNLEYSPCPPSGVDPRTLIRPLDKSLPSATRPTGLPYFAQESMQSCPPHQAPLAKKGGFSYKDWLATYNQRQPTDNLRGSCIPSLCTWCQPLYVDCCPDYKNPWSYYVAKKMAPYYF